MLWPLTLLAILLLSTAGPGWAQDDATSPEQQPHWAIGLGMRVERVNRSIPTVDRVVLVPDEATYVDELMKWSPRGRWPVLFEDDLYAPLFIDRFQPAQVLRRKSVGKPLTDSAQRRKLLEGIVIRAWGSDPTRRDMAEAFKRQNFTPPGVVITSDTDPAWTAAVALAAGHGQPLLWLDEQYGDPNSELPTAQTVDLLERINTLVDETGYPHDELGDAIDAITVCRRIPGRAAIKLPPAHQLNLPAFPWRNPLAITDLIGRAPQGGNRYAVTGWIFGDEIRSAYVAMCSLFLPRERVWLFNTYPDHGDWIIYRVDEAEQRLGKAGFQTKAYRRDGATYAAWRHLLPFGFQTDVFVMNSKGNPEIFMLYDERVGNAGDVPTLSRPLAVHFTHSWSMHRPDDPSTIACQWIRQGAYAYVGSVAEPILNAFIPPSDLAKRWCSYAPFLVAARHLGGPFGNPWKINTYGDPLMLCPPPGTYEAQRIPGPPGEGENLMTLAQTLLRDSENDETGQTLARAIATMNLLGRYDVSVQAWKLAVQRGVAAQAAQPALIALYQRHDVEGFFEAFELIPEHDDRTIGMLWHLAAPRIASTSDIRILNLLESNIRPAQRAMDVSQLAPALLRVFGHRHLELIIDQQIQSAQSRDVRKQLEAMRNQYLDADEPPSVGERFTKPPARGS